MGLTKTEHYTEAQIELSAALKVLGHPARIAILQAIMKSKTCICGDLVTEIGLAQSTVSQHLKELKTVGLIKGTVEGTSMCYCINSAKWIELKSTLMPLLDSGTECDAKNNCC